MIRPFILFLLLIFISTLSIAQKLEDYYVPISIDNTQGVRLKFLSDSTVEISSIPRHMSPSLKTVHKFRTADSTIQIFPDPFTTLDSQSGGLHVKTMVFKTKIILTKINGGFIDYNKSLI